MGKRKEERDIKGGAYANNEGERETRKKMSELEREFRKRETEMKRLVERTKEK